MLQAIRSKTAGLVVKVLFILLVGSFAVWGIGDYAFLRRSEQVAIRVDDVKISPEQLSAEYRREIERLRRTLGQFDPEIAKQFGLMDQVVDRLIRQTVFDKEAARLGIVVSDDVVRARIAANPVFHGPNGAFDRAVFQRVLSENGFSEGQYAELLRQDLSRAALVESIAAGGRAPDILVDRLYRHREERRVGETIFVPNASIENVGEPDEAKLKSVYDDNTERFSEPEYRALSVLRMSADDLVKTIQVTDEQLREEYEARLPELRTPERRDIEQMLFESEDAAKAAAEKVAAGTPFVDVARDVAKQGPDQTKLDGVQKSELAPELGEKIFALPEGGVAGPLHSPFGWHVIRVVKIYPGKEPTLDEVRDRLTTDVAQRSAANAAYDAAVKVEDAMASGAKLKEAAAKVGLSVLKVAAVDSKGLTPKGEPAPELANAPEAVQAAFQITQGEDSQLIEARSGAYFVIHVDGITPARVKSLDEVRPQVVELWKAEQRSEAARKRAESIAERVGKGATLADAAAEFNLKPETTAPVLRSGANEKDSQVPPEVIAQLFALKHGEAGVASTHDGHYVVRLSEIEPADPTADADGVKRLRTQIAQQIGGDLVAEFVVALRNHFGVTVDQQVVERVQ